MRCRRCRAKMVRDERFRRAFTYIIPYVCPKCGYRDSKMRSEKVFRRVAEEILASASESAEPSLLEKTPTP